MNQRTLLLFEQVRTKIDVKVKQLDQQENINGNRINQCLTLRASFLIKQPQDFLKGDEDTGHKIHFVRLGISDLCGQSVHLLKPSRAPDGGCNVSRSILKPRSRDHLIVYILKN